jgi:ribosome-associated toxin RatA of RatAB toxin-antitoxin module
MRSALIPFLALVIFLAIIPVAHGGPVTSKLTAAELEKVKGGEIILKKDIDGKTKSGSGIAYGVFKCDLDAFWSVLFDYDHYPEIFPRLNWVKVIEKTPNRIVVTFSMDATLKDLEYTTLNNLSQDKKRLDFHFDERFPHPYQKSLVGYWQLEEIEPGLLLAEYKLGVALDIPLIGKIIEKIVLNMSTKDLPDVLISIRKRIDSGGTWTRNQDKKK